MAIVDTMRNFFGGAPATLAMNGPSLAALMWRQALSDAERKRIDRYNAAWDVYLGRLKQPLVVKPNAPDDNVTVNYGRIVVDKGAAFLFGQEPIFELSEGETTPTEEWLADVWRRNRKQILLQKAAVNGAVCGHVFLKLQPARPGALPRILNLPPEYVAVDTDTDDIDQVWRYVIQYGAEGRGGEQLVVRQTIERDDGERWVVVDEVSRNGRAFEMQQEVIWPYDWPPIVDCQNLPAANDYYGVPDLTEDAVSLINAYNFVRSNTQRIIRYHAHPKTIAKGLQAQDLRMEADGTLILPDPTSDIFNLEMTTDLAGSLQQARELEDAILQLTRTPHVALAKVDGIGNLSGVALRILYGPLVEKTRSKQETYGELLVELNRRLLEMGGYGAENLTEIRWPNILPTNEKEQLETALLRHDVGVSRDTILSELGYDAEKERDKREMERETMLDSMQGAMSTGQFGDGEDV